MDLSFQNKRKTIHCVLKCVCFFHEKLELITLSVIHSSLLNQLLLTQLLLTQFYIETRWGASRLLSCSETFDVGDIVPFICANLFLRNKKCFPRQHSLKYNFKTKGKSCDYYERYFMKWLLFVLLIISALKSSNVWRFCDH